MRPAKSSTLCCSASAWDRRAWSDARPDKVVPVSGEDLLRRWVEELGELGFVPPSQFESGNVWAYLAIVGGGALGLGLLVPYLFYKLRKPHWRDAAAAAAVDVEE